MIIERLRIPLSWLLSLGLLTLAVGTQSRLAVDMPWVPPCLFFFGLLLASVATVGRLWCSIFIGGRKTSGLVEVGPYSLTRNPLYVCNLLGALGVGAASQTLVLPALIALGFGLYYPLVIRSEEARLRASHGAAFDAYCQRVPRFLPRWAAPTLPEEWVVNTRSFNRRLGDCGWFLVLVAGFFALHSARSLGWISAWWHLY